MQQLAVRLLFLIVVGVAIANRTCSIWNHTAFDEPPSDSMNITNCTDDSRCAFIATKTGDEESYVADCLAPSEHWKCDTCHQANVTDNVTLSACCCDYPETQCLPQVPILVSKLWCYSWDLENDQITASMQNPDKVNCDNGSTGCVVAVKMNPTTGNKYQAWCTDNAIPETPCTKGIELDDTTAERCYCNATAAGSCTPQNPLLLSEVAPSAVAVPATMTTLPTLPEGNWDDWTESTTKEEEVNGAADDGYGMAGIVAAAAAILYVY